MAFVKLLCLLIVISPALEGAVKDLASRGCYTRKQFTEEAINPPAPAPSVNTQALARGAFCSNLQMLLNAGFTRRTSFNRSTFLRRFKRENKCARYWPNDFECRDGTCITADKKCDGKADCPDGTDEMHYLCRKTQCPDYMFRCTYGACVDGSAPCNGVSNCFDNSDELQPKCNNSSTVIGDQFKCGDGSLVELYRRCDGISDCSDGSDETLVTCAGNICPSYLFQCAYGACVEEGADCNDVDNCADGSDESDMLCKRIIPRVTPTTAAPTSVSTAIVRVLKMCMLPPHPKNGRFSRNGDSNSYTPGEVMTTVYLNISCEPGYMVLGDKVVFCIEGLWYPVTQPSCVRACKLPPSETVEYRCVIHDATFEGTRECTTMEAEGSVVKPECRPNYYSPTALPYMFCVDGHWSHTPVCQPECGTLTPVAEPLIAGGALARRGEVPWHITVYSQLHEQGTFQQICGGSLISDDIFISGELYENIYEYNACFSPTSSSNYCFAAAHCFWMESSGALPPEVFAAVAGKLYRSWNDPRDLDFAQFSPIKEIILAKRFGGAELLYQDDLAVVRVSDKFSFRPYIRPVCIDFGLKFNDFQLRPGNKGKVAGFGLTSDQRGSESAELKVVDLPYVGWKECRQSTPPEYSAFLIGNKFCAGFLNSTALCKGDSGGGLAFPSYAEGTLRYTLRGVTSTGPLAANGAPCNLHALTAFTALQPHQNLVRTYLH